MNLQWFFFSFKGRITRKPFWIFNLSASVVWLIIMLLSGADFHNLTREPNNIAFDIVILWPALAVQVKRWHDLNKSGWNILVNLIPLIGPIWAIVQTAVIPGTPGANRYGNDPLGKEEDKPKKVFIAAESTPYFAEVMLFIFLPIAVIWIVVGSLMRGNWLVLIVVVPVFIFLFFFFKFLRNKRVFRIVTNESGISFYGLLKEVTSPWPDVLSVGINSESFQDMIEVKTAHGSFQFPFSMKNEAEEYPKFEIGMSGFKWAYADGTKEDGSGTNNPLYLEINSRIKHEGET